MRSLFGIFIALSCFLCCRAFTPLQSSRLIKQVTVLKATSSERHWISNAAVALATLLTASQMAVAKPEGVFKPELLPKDFTTVIDTANFLSKGQEKRLVAAIADLEKNTGFKVRVLCQSYPNTPGLAIKDYWNVDDNTVVLVADRGEGFNRKGMPSNIINLNIGKNADNVLPNMFWNRLSNKLGNTFYWKENGEDIAVINAVNAITYCLQDTTCKDIPFSI